GPPPVSSAGSSLAVAFVGTALCSPAAGASRAAPCWFCSGLSSHRCLFPICHSNRIDPIFSCAPLSGAPGRAVDGSWPYLAIGNPRRLHPRQGVVFLLLSPLYGGGRPVNTNAGHLQLSTLNPQLPPSNLASPLPSIS